MGKAIKLQNKKTGELLYPMTASDMVFDPETKKSVKADLAGKIGDAPSDGKQYARKDGAWNEVNMPEGGVEEAPKDGLQYVRKDGSWEQISPEEFCQITLKSNQGDSDAASLVGISVKVIVTEDSSDLFNGSWNGETIIVSVEQGKEYKVVCGALDGYATPVEQTFTASAFVNRDVVMMYNTEVVRVTLSADDSSSVSGQIVTINGEAFTYGSTTVEKKIPFGTEYTVSVNDKSGYTTPSAQTFTASQSERNLEVVYAAIPYGVYIQGVSGKLYTADDWNSQETANGLALYTENCKLLIPMEQFYQSGYEEIMLGDSSIKPNLTKYETKESAIQDFNGKQNTNTLTAAYGDTSTNIAPFKCKNYTLPNGQKNCYLPSCGELTEIFLNYASLNSLMQLWRGSDGGDIRYQRVWTSTRATDDSAYSTPPAQFWNIYYIVYEDNFEYYQYSWDKTETVMVVAPLSL